MDENYPYNPNDSYPPTQPTVRQNNYVQPHPADVQQQRRSVQPKERNKGKCIASMILGLVSISTLWPSLYFYLLLSWIPISTAIAAVALGGKGMKEIPAGMSGHGMANAGRILGGISICTAIVLTICWIIIVRAAGTVALGMGDWRYYMF